MSEIHHRCGSYLMAVLLSISLPCFTSAQEPESTIDPTPHTRDKGIVPAKTLSSPVLEQRPGLRRLLRDEAHIWASPFRTDTYDSHTMKKYGIPFLLITGGLIATDHRTADLLPNTPDQVVWSSRISKIGAAYSLAGFSGATYLIGRAAHNDHMRETGMLGLEAMAHAHLVVFGIKQATQRERPLQNNEGRSFWKGGNSFPSGHAASSFALATVFAYEYRDHIAVPIAAYSLASLVAASRVSARRHWASDIFVGSSLGFLIGRYIYKTHHDSTLLRSPVQRTGRLMPEIGFSSQGLSLMWFF